MFSLEKILLPVDFSDHSKSAARYAKALASRAQSQLTLLHVVEMPFGGAMLDVTHVTQAREQLETFLARARKRDRPLRNRAVGQNGHIAPRTSSSP